MKNRYFLITIIGALMVIMLGLILSETEATVLEAESTEIETTFVEETEIETEAEVETETISITEVSTKSDTEYISLGEFKITAYCSCKKCCGIYADQRPNGVVYGASGAELISNYSIAVDPRVIPYGTKVYIDGREYIAHDTGGAINGNRIDLYMSNHNEALEWGVRYYDVCIMK